MKATVCMLFILIAGLGCREPSVPKGSSIREKSMVDSVMSQIYRTPDSLKTPEQRQILKKVRIAIAKYVQLRDGNFSFVLPKEQFVKKTGLDIAFYDAFIKNMEENNSMSKKMNFKDKEMEEQFNKDKRRWLNDSL